MKKLVSWICALACLGASIWTTPALAANQTVSGAHITNVFVSLPGNYAFRIYLDTPATLPGPCNYNFIYIDTNNGNYQAYVSTLLLAYSTNKKITVTYSIDANGLCQLQEFETVS